MHVETSSTVNVVTNEADAGQTTVLETEPIGDYVTDERVVEEPMTSSNSVKKKPFFYNFLKTLITTREIATTFTRDEFIVISLKEALVYIIFMVILCIVTMGHANALIFYNTKVMDSLLTKSRYRYVDSYTQMMTAYNLQFNSLRTTDHVWAYLTHILLLLVDDHHIQPHGALYILTENRMMGLARLRQVRVRNNSCYIPKSVNYLITDCYGPYSELNEDKDPFGLRTGPEWTYNSPHHLGSYPFTGEAATYGGGGYYIDLDTHVNETSRKSMNRLKATMKETLKRLYNQNWPDRGMRALFLDFATYNVNVDLFCFVKLVFEFTPTGAIITSSSLKAQKLLRYSTHFDYFILLSEIVFVILTVYYMCLEMYKMYHFKRNYFKLFWNWIDLILLILLYIVIILSIYEYTKVKMELTPLIRTSDTYSNFDALSYVHSLCTTSLAITVFFAWVKLLKYLSIFNSMNELQKTIYKASGHIACFTVIFAIVFVAFTHVGYILFNSQVKGFHTFICSLLTLIRAVAGDFSFSTIEDADFVIGSIFFFCFVYTIFFITLNMFTAIMVSIYGEDHEREVNRGVQISIVDLLKKWYIAILCKLKLHRLADVLQKKILHAKTKTNYEDIHNLLKRCGYSEMEINLFFHKYGIEENTHMNDEDIQKILANIGSSVVRDPHAVEGIPVPDYPYLYHKMGERVDTLQEAVYIANTKVDRILNKLDAIQQIQMTSESSESNTLNTDNS